VTLSAPSVFDKRSFGGTIHLKNAVVPFIAQVPPGTWGRTNNCGQAAVLMVASYYNKTIPTPQDIRDIDDWESQIGNPA
jgi:hypothetical protein